MRMNMGICKQVQPPLPNIPPLNGLNLQVLRSQPQKEKVVTGKYSRLTRMPMVVCKQVQQPLLNILPPPNGLLNMQVLRPQPQKQKVVIIMGATGTGKSRLSIALATRFQAEVINSDKIQVYNGLDIVTNKITEAEQCGIPHHLLGTMNPNSDFTVSNFCDTASRAVRSIVDRGRLPIIVGGSNSYIESLVDEKNHEYECCFLWVDVSIPVLHSFVSDRVDQMVQSGMVEEVRDVFDPKADYSRGIRRAIGVPEFHHYFKMEPFLDEETRARLLQQVINEIKKNTQKLACRQLEKIYRLRNVKGWKLHRLDATDVFRKKGKEADEAWERLVAGPSFAIVSRFLYNKPVRCKCDAGYAAAVIRATASAMGAVMAILVAFHYTNAKMGLAILGHLCVQISIGSGLLTY